MTLTLRLQLRLWRRHLQRDSVVEFTSDSKFSIQRGEIERKEGKKRKEKGRTLRLENCQLENLRTSIFRRGNLIFISERREWSLLAQSSVRGSIHFLSMLVAALSLCLSLIPPSPLFRLEHLSVTLVRFCVTGNRPAREHGM